MNQERRKERKKKERKKKKENIDYKHNYVLTTLLKLYVVIKANTIGISY